MKHPFIVIEGLDGSGKATQTNQLCKALKQKQIKYRHLTFPDYEQDSSALIKLYLSGAFGTERTDCFHEGAAGKPDSDL